MQMMDRLFKWVSLFSLIFTTSLCEEESQANGEVAGRDTKGLSLELISEVQSISAGQSFQLGFKIEHDEGFHTYWRNPGIVGVPLTLHWELPKGFTASEIRWPYPELSKMADYPCFGYERDVLLTVEITPPKDLSADQVQLKVTANWMCCSSICYPDIKTFSLTLAAGDGAKNQKHLKLFQKAKTELPTKATALQAELLSAPDAQEIQVQILSDDKKKIISVFNSDGQTSPDLESNLNQQHDGSWLYTAAKSSFGPKSSESFPFVVQTSQGYFALEAR